MKRQASLLACVGLSFLLWAAPAQAHLIDLGSYFLELDNANPGTEGDWIEEEFTVGPLTYLNKYDVGSGWSGVPPAAVPSSNFTIVENSGTSWDVSWDLTGTGYQALYVLVKDGGFQGGTYYQLFQVSGDQNIAGGPDEIYVFDTDGKARNISHAIWFGNAVSVPDGGATLALLGGALLGIGVLRRRFNV